MPSRRGHEEAACQLEYSKTRIVLVVATLTTITKLCLVCMHPIPSTKNNVCLEIKRRITLANRCSYDLHGQLSNRGLSRKTKLILQKTLILPALLYDAEAWTLLSTDAVALRVFERKVLRKTFGPVRVGDDYRIRFNSELYELLNDIDVVQRINI